MAKVICLLTALMLLGCGDQPSTPIAPDQPLPDTSKMSAEDIQKLHSEGSATEKGQASIGSTPNNSRTDHGYTPPDRQTGR